MYMFVYAIQSQINNFIYVGMTGNVNIRLEQHNSGKNKSTKAYRPWKLFYEEYCVDQISARKREKQLKSGYGKEFLKSILK